MKSTAAAAVLLTLVLTMAAHAVAQAGSNLNDMSQVIAVMILIIAIGYVADGLMFKTMEPRLQYKWGLTRAA